MKSLVAHVGHRLPTAGREAMRESSLFEPEHLAGTSAWRLGQACQAIWWHAWEEGWDVSENDD